MASGSFGGGKGTTNNEHVGASITWSSTTNIPENYSTVTATLKYSRLNTGYTTSGTFKGSITINGTSIKGEKYISVTYNSNTEAMSASAKVYHNDDGGKTINISASGYISGSSVSSTSVSGTVTLDTIPRASSFSVSSITLGSACTISVTRKSTSFAHTIRYVCGSASGWVQQSKTTNTSISFTPNISLSAQNTIGANVNIDFYLQTYDGTSTSSHAVSGEVKTTVSASIPSSVAPTCTVTTEDSTGYYETFGAFIQGFSRLKITTNATQAYSSPIASYNVNVSGANYSGNPITTNILSSAGSVSYTATVTDRRGRTGSNSGNVTVIAYTSPTLYITVVRSDADGTESITGEYCNVVYAATYQNIQNNYKTAFYFRYKKASESNWTTVNLDMPTYLVESNYIFHADSASSYDVEFYLADRISSTTYATSLSTAMSTFHFPSMGYGLGIGKVLEHNGCVEFGWPVRLYNGIVGSPLVIDEGTNGIWVYRKWDSGVAECWGMKAYNVTSWASWGVLYESSLGRVNYPSNLFIEMPSLFLGCANTSAGILCFEVYGVGDKNSTPAIYAVRPSSVSTLTFQLSLYAVGKWK